MKYFIFLLKKELKIMTTLQIAKVLDGIEKGLADRIQLRTIQFGGFREDCIPLIVDAKLKDRGLSPLFVWKNTPEGHRYWSEINIKIMELL